MELATIVRRYAKELSEGTPDLLPGQKKALAAIAHCRTPACGEMLAWCPSCGRTERFSFSCGHRFCPKCQNHETTQWLERQRQKLLPVTYFLLTFTLPSELRALAYHHQRVIYDALFRASSQALRELAGKPRYLGGEIGMTGVLHPNGRRLEYHPHVHFVVPAGGLNRKRNRWKKSTRNFLVKVQALGRLFRGKFLALIIEQGFTFPHKVTKLDWVVHCEPAGRGEKALEYLSRYLYRGALSEKQIISDRDGQVTFSYVESKTGKRKTRTLPGVQFLRLLLALVLPKGFRRARDYGFLHGRAKKTLAFLQLVLRVKIRPNTEVPRPSLRCPRCGQSMQIIAYRLEHGPVAIRGSP
jgi:hypothetical protein